MILAVPNFPLVITPELIKQFGEPCKLEHYVTFRYQEHWRIYADRNPEANYWTVNVVTQDDWLLQFDIEDDGPAFNIGMFRAWFPARHNPMAGRNAGFAWGRKENPIYERYASKTKRRRWDFDVEPLPWQTPEDVDPMRIRAALQSYFDTKEGD